jgi:phosphoglycolate phosphatase
MACVFDVDGTLLDSLRDIGESLNTCLELLGLPTHPIDSYRFMVGEGIPKLCQRAVGDSHPHLVERLAELARPHYRTRALRHTRPFPGVPELVDRLHGNGVRLAVLSNKPDALTRRVVQAFWPSNPFSKVVGYRNEEHRKPSPHYLNEICDALDVPTDRTWYIGDTPVDVQTALAAGTYAVGVTWGFRTRAELSAAGAHRIIEHPDELP